MTGDGVPGPPRWLWRLLAVVAVLVSVLLVGAAYDATQHRLDTSADTQRIALALARNTECARQIASNYEDKRDDIFAALNDRAQLQAAVNAFAAFKQGPTGKPESRADRTTRLCPSPNP